MKQVALVAVLLLAGSQHAWLTRADAGRGGAQTRAGAADEPRGRLHATVDPVIDALWVGYDARPAAVKTALAYTLNRLGTDYVDVYRPARLDPAVPIEDTVGAIAEMVDAGYVRHIGLSEVGAATLRRAQAVRDSVIAYASSRGLTMDKSQIQPVGVGSGV